MWPFSANSERVLRYRAISRDFAVSGQISPDDVQKVADAGFKTIVCARPENEEAGQPPFQAIAAAAEKAGIAAVHIPISGGVRESERRRMEEALKSLPAPMFGYCRSGARAGALYQEARAFLR